MPRNGTNGGSARARSRVTLQPTLTVSAAATQEARYAQPVGNAKAGVCVANVYRNTMGVGTVTFTIETASHTGLSAQSGSFWATAGSGAVTAPNTGSVSIPIADLGEVIRWTVAGVTSAIDFEIVVFFEDA